MRMFGNLMLVILIVFLLNHALIGNAWHEYLGVVFIFFMLVHLAYTEPSLKTLFQGRQSGMRILSNIVNMMLVFFLLTTIITGYLISTSIFPIIQLRGIVFIWMHEIHQGTAYISFILAGVHFGLQWSSIWNRIKKYSSFTEKKLYRCIFYIGIAFISAYAIYVSFLHHMGDRILMEHMVSIGNHRTPLEYGLDLTMIFFAYAIFAAMLKRLIRK